MTEILQERNFTDKQPCIEFVILINCYYYFHLIFLNVVSFLKSPKAHRHKQRPTCYVHGYYWSRCLSTCTRWRGVWQLRQKDSLKYHYSEENGLGSTLKRNYIPIPIRVTWWSYQFKSCKCVWLLCVNQMMQSYAFSEQDNILELAGVKYSNVWLPARWYFELTFQIVLPPASHWCIMSVVKINCWLNLGFTRSSVSYFPASRCALGKIPNVAPTEMDAVCEMWIYDGIPVDLLHSAWIKLAWMKNDKMGWSRH